MLVGEGSGVYEGSTASPEAKGAAAVLGLGTLVGDASWIREGTTASGVLTETGVSAGLAGSGVSAGIAVAGGSELSRSGAWGVAGSWGAAAGEGALTVPPSPHAVSRLIIRTSRRIDSFRIGLSPWT